LGGGLLTSQRACSNCCHCQERIKPKQGSRQQQATPSAVAQGGKSRGLWRALNCREPTTPAQSQIAPAAGEQFQRQGRLKTAEGLRLLLTAPLAGGLQQQQVNQTSALRQSRAAAKEAPRPQQRKPLRALARARIRFRPASSNSSSSSAGSSSQASSWTQSRGSLRRFQRRSVGAQGAPTG